MHNILILKINNIAESLNLQDVQSMNRLMNKLFNENSVSQKLPKDDSPNDSRSICISLVYFDNSKNKKALKY
ncbi:hypothetical protein HX13_19485 [Chryseobacterium sp. P1-3]|nr:hypothetical protein HX13_19485 [Chryseobacterium sp. P1-3]